MRFHDREEVDLFPGACKDRLIYSRTEDVSTLEKRKTYTGYQLAFMRHLKPTSARFELQFKETPVQFTARVNAMSQTLFLMLCQDIPLSFAGYRCKENTLVVRLTVSFCPSKSISLSCRFLTLLLNTN